MARSHAGAPLRSRVDSILLSAVAAVLAGCASEAPPQDLPPQEPPPQEVRITGVDYAFAVPDSIGPGRSLLRFENAGAVDHEVAVARLVPGSTLADVLEAMEAGRDPEDLVDEQIGVLFAAPGQTGAGQLLVDLISGRTYVLLCFFQDEPDAPPHNALGMFASFEVL